MFRTVILGGLLVIGFIITIDPWPRYLKRIPAEVVAVEGRGRFSGPATTIRVQLKEGATIRVTIADTTVKAGDRLVLLVFESRIFKRRSYEVSLEGLSRSANHETAESH